MPQLGVKAAAGDPKNLERMTALFLKTCRSVIHSNYSVILGHSPYPLFSQGKMLRLLQRIVPRCYKKNLSRVYILHPTPRLRAIFTIRRLFVDEKFAQKVVFAHSISQLQAVLTPAGVPLPAQLLRLELSARPPVSPRDMPPLRDLYVS